MQVGTLNSSRFQVLQGYHFQNRFLKPQGRGATFSRFSFFLMKPVCNRSVQRFFDPYKAGFVHRRRVRFLGFHAAPSLRVRRGAATSAHTAISTGSRPEGSISHARFHELMRHPSHFHLIDVRDRQEFADGHLKGAVNIPLKELYGFARFLPGDKPIIFQCKSGKRSGEAYELVKKLRPDLAANIRYLDGELTIHGDGTGVLAEKGDGLATCAVGDRETTSGDSGRQTATCRI